MKAPVCPYPLVDAEPGRNYFDEEELVQVAATHVGLEVPPRGNVAIVRSAILDGPAVSFLVYGLGLKLEEFSCPGRGKDGELDGTRKLNTLALFVRFFVESDGVRLVADVDGVDRLDRNEELASRLFKYFAIGEMNPVPSGDQYLKRARVPSVVNDLVNSKGEVFIAWKELGLPELIPTKEAVDGALDCLLWPDSVEGEERLSLSRAPGSPLRPSPDSIPEGYVTLLAKALLLDRWETQLRTYKQSESARVS